MYSRLLCTVCILSSLTLIVQCQRACCQFVASPPTTLYVNFQNAYAVPQQQNGYQAQFSAPQNRPAAAQVSYMLVQQANNGQTKVLYNSNNYQGSVSNPTYNPPQGASNYLNPNAMQVPGYVPQRDQSQTQLQTSSTPTTAAPNGLANSSSVYYVAANPSGNENQLYSNPSNQQPQYSSTSSSQYGNPTYAPQYGQNYVYGPQYDQSGATASVPPAMNDQNGASTQSQPSQGFTGSPNSQSSTQFPSSQSPRTTDSSSQPSTSNPNYFVPVVVPVGTQQNASPSPYTVQTSNTFTGPGNNPSNQQPNYNQFSDSTPLPSGAQSTNAQNNINSSPSNAATTNPTNMPGYSPQYDAPSSSNPAQSPTSTLQPSPELNQNTAANAPTTVQQSSSAPTSFTSAPTSGPTYRPPQTDNTEAVPPQQSVSAGPSSQEPTQQSGFSSSAPQPSDTASTPTATASAQQQPGTASPNQVVQPGVSNAGGSSPELIGQGAAPTSNGEPEPNPVQNDQPQPQNASPILSTGSHLILSLLSAYVMRFTR